MLKKTQNTMKRKLLTLFFFLTIGYSFSQTETITIPWDLFSVPATDALFPSGAMFDTDITIEIGDTVITRKHTVTDADIVNFANVSGDNFYAHVDATSLDETIFEKNVAHGYWVLSKAAGLFVDGKKGPVLLNYGLDECRFTKPVYPGMTLGVRFTAKEKISQEKKTFTEGEEIPKGMDIKKGIVKFLVDVYDETGETVALATILTMVKFKNQD